MDAPWRIELLGRLRATQGDRVVTRFRARKTGLLLAYLAYYIQRPHPREALIDLLWPEADLSPGRGNLSKELSSLRRQLEPPGVPVGAVIVADHFAVQLNPAACVTDVAQFESALQSASRAGNDRDSVCRLVEAVELYAGELLPGYYEEWILQERQHLAEQCLGAIHQLVSALEQAGDLESALEHARRAVRADPMREEAHFDLIRLYAAAGQPSAALRQYHELERLLRDELDETPSAATRALAEELRRDARTVVVARSAPPEVTPAGERGAPSPAAPVEAAPLRPSRPTPRLPLQFTRFFGREEEIARLAETLLCSEARLVTLTGPGGSGKTRLTIAVADRLQEAFREAIAFVPLADLTDADQIPDAIMKALDLPRSADLDPLEQVVEVLNRHPSLLVLDNLEHLVEEGALLVKRLLERIPTLTCLVTSRQRLSLAGEQEFVVLPLPTPRRSDSPERLLQYASVKLFVDRAQAVRADFQVTAANASAIAALCDRLEGLPLALELAAARALVLTPDQMLARLEERFDFLVSRQRGASSRHRTLRGAIDWSYRLLSADLRRAFARLSVFHGGWTLEAARPSARSPRCWSTSSNCGSAHSYWRKRCRVRRASGCWRRFDSTHGSNFRGASKGRRCGGGTGTTSSTWRRGLDRTYRGQSNGTGWSDWRQNTRTCV